jgi:hypothetical protein
MPAINVGQAILPAAAFQAASSAWREFSSVRSPSLSPWPLTRREQTSVAQELVKIRLAAPGLIAKQRQLRRHIATGAVGQRSLNIMRECKVRLAVLSEPLVQLISSILLVRRNGVELQADRMKRVGQFAVGHPSCTIAPGCRPYHGGTLLLAILNLCSLLSTYQTSFPLLWLAPGKTSLARSSKPLPLKPTVQISSPPHNCDACSGITPEPKSMLS